MDYSNLFAKFLDELLSRDLEPLEKDFYEKIVEELRKAKNEDKISRSVAVTLRFLFILRLIKELEILYRGSTLNLEDLPSLEREVLSKVTEALRSLVPQYPSRELQVKPSEAKATEDRHEPQPQDKKTEEKTLVFFLQPYPRIIDRNIILGPFNKGDIAFIPKRLAKDLIASGYVEEIAEGSGEQREG